MRGLLAGKCVLSSDGVGPVPVIYPHADNQLEQRAIELVAPDRNATRHTQAPNALLALLAFPRRRL
jgi:hypothetical protein